MGLGASCRIAWGGVFLAAVLAPIVATETPARADELTLGRALKLAKQRAPEMKAARARVANAEAQIGVARAGYYPGLNVTGSVTEDAAADRRVFRPSEPPLNFVNYTTLASAAAQLRWTLYDFGKTGNAVDSAEAARDAASAGALDSEAGLISAVANAYLDVYYTQRARDIQHQIVEDREKSFVVVKALVKQGISPAVEELRSRSRIEAARRDLETSESRLSEAKVALLAFLALDTKSDPKFVQPKLSKPRMEMEAAAKEAEEKKPSVVAAKALATAAEETVDSTRARYYPTIGINGDAHLRYTKLDIFDQWFTNRGASGTIMLTIPIFEPSNSSRLDASKAEAARAEATYEQARRDARTEGARAVVALSTSEKVLDHARKAAESTGAVLAVIRARFAQGLTSMLDLIEAETSDADARVLEVNAERAVDAALIRVYLATGRFGRIYDVP